MSAQEFVLDDAVYVGLLFEDYAREPQWMKMDTDIWDKSEMLAQQLGLLETAEPEYLGEETVDGVACHILEFTPDVAGAWSLMSQQGVFGDDVKLPGVDPEDVKSVRTRQWIARETSRIVKAEVEMTLYLEAQDVDPSLETGGMDVELTGEILFHHYNEPVSIELPPAVIEQTS